MLSFLQLQDRLSAGFLFLIFLVVFISFSSAFELGISPPVLVFEGNVRERVCRNISIFSDRTGISLLISDKWTNKKDLTRDIEFYNIDSSNLWIELNYNNKIIVDRKYEREVCLIAENNGLYQGLLTFDVRDRSLGLGSWILANITGEDIRNKSLTNSITGFITGDSVFVIDKNGLLFLLFFLMSVLLASLVILIKNLNTKRLKETQITTWTYVNCLLVTN